MHFFLLKKGGIKLRVVLIVMLLSMIISTALAANIEPIVLPGGDDSSDVTTIQEHEQSMQNYVDAKINTAISEFDARIDPVIADVNLMIHEQVSKLETKLGWLALAVVSAIIFGIFLNKALGGLK